MLVKLKGRIELLNPPVAQDGDAVRDSHSLLLVVGYNDGGDPRLSLQFLDHLTDLNFKPGVQIGHRFVEQKNFRLLHHCAAHGHALLLPAGELGRLAVQKMLDLQLCRHFPGPVIALLPGHLFLLQRKGDVVDHPQVGVQGVGLEHHADVALLGRFVCDIHLVRTDGAVRGIKESCDTV